MAPTSPRPADGFSRRGWLTLAAVAAASLGSTAEAATALEDLGYATPYDQYDPDPIAESPSVWQAYLFDKQQNLWRFAGDLDKAESIVDEWRSTSPDDPGAADRAGEIAFLRGDYPAAATWFAKAAAGFTSTTARGALGRAGALLKQGAAEGQAGQRRRRQKHAAQVRFPPAHSAARAAERFGWPLRRGAPGGADRLLCAGAARRRRPSRARLCQRGPDYRAAVEHVSRVRRSSSMEPPLPSRLKNGAVENNLALAHILLGSGAPSGRDRQGRRRARSAESDLPADPGVRVPERRPAGRGGRHLPAGARLRRDALPRGERPRRDPRQAGPRRRGADRLPPRRRRQSRLCAGLVQPGRAPERHGARHYLEAQGALGRAARLDPALRDRDRQLIYDAEPYYSGLDLSRPLPPEWRFVETERRVPAALTVIVLLLLVGRLIWNLGLDQASGKVGERLLRLGEGRETGGRTTWLHLLTRPVWPAGRDRGNRRDLPVAVVAFAPARTRGCGRAGRRSARAARRLRPQPAGGGPSGRHRRAPLHLAAGRRLRRRDDRSRTGLRSGASGTRRPSNTARSGGRGRRRWPPSRWPCSSSAGGLVCRRPAPWVPRPW